MYFKYGKKEITHLQNADKKLGVAIEQIGKIKRETTDNLFSSVIHSIVGQQISTAAQMTIWNRLVDMLENVDCKCICSLSEKELQSIGISFRKVEYIKDFALKVKNAGFDLEALKTMSDDEVIKSLSSLKGIGVWTAEMIMIFCMQRKNILSFGDLAILRGMRMLYGYQEIDRQKFEEYAKAYSPYGSVASLYLWAVAGNAIEGLADPAAEKENKIKKSSKK